MNAQWVLALVGAALLFLLDLGLSVALGAIEALSRVALHRLSAEADGRHAFLGQLKDDDSSYRAAALLLRQLSLLGATGLSIVAAGALGVGSSVAAGVGVACLLGVLLSEAVLSQLLALRDPRTALRITAGLIRAARFILYPFVVPLSRLKRIAGQQTLTEEQREEDQEEEVEALIEVGEREGLLEGEEGAMMRGIVDLDETRVREIMTPRIDILALSDKTTVEQARKKLLEAGHSRMPVYRESIDEVVGILHERDLFRAWEGHDEQQSIATYLRPAIHVPEALSAAELLSEMRTKTKMALVVDEFGGISGLVTLEDVLEEIVGEIRDEHEQDEEDEVRLEADGSYTVRAVSHVGELEKLFDVTFENRDFDTVGGLVVNRIGRVPAAGERIQVEGLEIEVLEANRQRIKRVRVRRVETGDETGVRG